MIRFEEKPSEPKESAKKPGKAEGKTEAKAAAAPATEPAADGEGNLPLGDSPSAAAPAKKRGAPRKPRKT